MKTPKEKIYFRYAWSDEKFEGYKKRIPYDYFQHPDFAEAWEEYVLYRSVIKLPLTEYAAFTNLLDLYALAGSDHHKALASVRQTIGSGKWSAFYAPKDYVKPHTQPIL